MREKMPGKGYKKIRLTKKAISLFLVLCVLFSFSSCASKKEIYSSRFSDLFDTVSVISACDKSQNDFDKKTEKVKNELSRYSKLFDIYKSYKGIPNLKTVNDSAGKSPVKVSGDIISLLKFGQRVYNLTSGRVNIAMGSVLSIWHKYREGGLKDEKNASLPPELDLKEASRHTNIKNLVIDEKNKTVFLKDPKMSLDVGSIAKGFVCEKISAYIKTNGIWNSAVINLGGNVKTIGFKNEKQGKNFNIAIEDPDGGDYADVVSVSNGLGVSTSGDYQRYYTVKGKKYCHIIDPSTLFPASFSSSVSVIAKNSALCDAYSTAMFLMSISDALKFANDTDGVEVLIIDKNGKKYKSVGYEKLEK